MSLTSLAVDASMEYLPRMLSLELILFSQRASDDGCKASAGSSNDEAGRGRVTLGVYFSCFDDPSNGVLY